MHHELLMPRNQTAAMSMLLRAVATGYRYYQSGEVAAAKACGLAVKLDRKFEWSADRVQRQYLRRHDLAASRLVMAPARMSGTLRWWLLVTPGAISDEAGERAQFMDSWSHRTPVLWDQRYRLEHIQVRRASGGGRRWTWQIQPQRREGYLAVVESLCRRSGRHRELGNFLAALARMPGFHGVRADVLRLHHDAMGIWRRYRRSDWPFPTPQMPWISASFELHHSPPLPLSRYVTAWAPPQLDTNVGGTTILTQGGFSEWSQNDELMIPDVMEVAA